MNVSEAILTRRSIRRYSNQPIPRELICEILSEARWAPSWKNSQTVRYLVVDDAQRKNAISAAPNMPVFNSKVIAQAPVLIVMVTKKGISGYTGGEPDTTLDSGWQMFDAGIAAQTLCLAAWERGLGSLIMGLYDEAALPELLKDQLAADEQITALVALGYAADQPKGPGRKELEAAAEFVK